MQLIEFATNAIGLATPVPGQITAPIATLDTYSTLAITFGTHPAFLNARSPISGLITKSSSNNENIRIKLLRLRLFLLHLHSWQQFILFKVYFSS